MVHFSLWWSMTDCFMFVCLLLGPLFGWLIFSSEAGTESITLNCWNQDSSSAFFSNICSSLMKFKSSCCYERLHGGFRLVVEGCDNEHEYICEKGTFHFRPVAIIRRTEALALVEVSCIFFFAYFLSWFRSKQPQQEQQKKDNELIKTLSLIWIPRKYYKTI